MTRATWQPFALAGLCMAVANPAWAQDPGEPGPFAVSTASYGSWSDSVSLGSIPTIEVLGQVNYPTDLTQGPYPLVVLLHGRHGACYNADGVGIMLWPCCCPKRQP